MSSETRNILIFEDKTDNYQELLDPLEAHPQLEDFSTDRFPPEETGPEAEPSEVLNPYLHDPHPDLVVLDWDLGGYKSGVRRQHVRSACEELGIPLCVYHRDEGHFSNPEELKEYDENLIRIDVKDTSEQVADAIATIATSFVQIRQAIRENEVEGVHSALSEALGVPSSAQSQLEQYSMGQSTTVQVAKSDMSDDEKLRVISTLIGYWIHNQILEYPGVLLNEVATASYLAVDHEEFQELEGCKEQLEDAEYDGPFSGLTRDNWWWTNLLDDLRLDLPLDENGDLLDGSELFEELCDQEMSPAVCTEGGEPKAGYYCILTDEPVCEEHSRQPSGWIPVGATRSRISDSEFKKVNAWMPD